MEAELKILSIIGENNQNITQRDLSAQTELSLGTINLLLKKMIEKGFIKIEKLSTRTVRYMLTPKGMMEKARKTYAYVKRTYENIMLMKGELTRIVKNMPENSTLYLYGEEDEVYGMLTLLLNELVSNSHIALRKIETVASLGCEDTVIVWHEGNIGKLTNATCINILDKLV